MMLSLRKCDAKSASGSGSQSSRSSHSSRRSHYDSSSEDDSEDEDADTGENKRSLLMPGVARSVSVGLNYYPE